MESAPFLNLWIVGQAYIIATIICLVVGNHADNSNLPGWRNANDRFCHALIGWLTWYYLCSALCMVIAVFIR